MNTCVYDICHEYSYIKISIFSHAAILSVDKIARKAKNSEDGSEYQWIEFYFADRFDSIWVKFLRAYRA